MNQCIWIHVQVGIKIHLIFTTLCFSKMQRQMLSLVMSNNIHTYERRHICQLKMIPVDYCTFPVQNIAAVSLILLNFRIDYGIMCTHWHRLKWGLRISIGSKFIDQDCVYWLIEHFMLYPANWSDLLHVLMVSDSIGVWYDNYGCGVTISGFEEVGVDILRY